MTFIAYYNQTAKPLNDLTSSRSWNRNSEWI